MGKFVEYINSGTIDKNTLWSHKFASSVCAWMLLFFYIDPKLISIVSNIFGRSDLGWSTVSGIIDILLYYVLNAVIATLVVKWQNRKLDKKSVKFRKICWLVYPMILVLFVLASIAVTIVSKT